MWVFTSTGFYSISKSKYCREGELAVRARAPEDLTVFLEKTGFSTEILEFPDADYPHRVHAPVEVVQAFLQQEVASLNYNDFKHACFETNPKRGRALGAIWEAAWRWWR